MRSSRVLLMLCVIVGIMVSSLPAPSATATIATNTPATPDTCKRLFCKPECKKRECPPAELTASAVPLKIFNDRLAIQVDDKGYFNIGALPDPLTGNATARSWNLTYSWPELPGSSFTTVRIDGSSYYYGDISTQLEPPQKINARTIRSRREVNGVEITQTIQIGANPHTGQKDAAIVSYTFRNTASVTRSAGLRMLMDTSIKEQDGFPFRVPGSGVISNETEFVGANVPDVFLASRTALDTTYLTAATLKSNGATAPDRLVLANWGNILDDSAPDQSYDYVVKSNMPLTDDSAYVLFWNAKPLAPGETRSYTTLYGLGQAATSTIAPLVLSVRGPNTLTPTASGYAPNPFDVVATVVNTGTTTLNSVSTTLSLPAGLTRVSGTQTQTIPSLAPGAEQQVSWKVEAALQSTATTHSYSVSVGTSTIPARTVSSQIKLLDIDATRKGPLEVAPSEEYRFAPKKDNEILDLRANYEDRSGNVIDTVELQTEIWGRVYWPKDLSKGPYPLVVFLHGNHSTCGQFVDSTKNVRVDGSIEYTFYGRCTGEFPIVTPNHEGYTYLAETLASHGYIVVSINANRGITGLAEENLAGDHTLVLARGRQVLRHLQLWNQWNTTGTADASFGPARPGTTAFNGSRFRGKVDLSNVGLMGHSRGGQGVRAAYQLYRETGSAWHARVPNLDIKGIFEIGPTDVIDADTPEDPTTLPPHDPYEDDYPEPITADGTAWTVLLPMCDGDVITLDGVRAFDRTLAKTDENPAAFKAAYGVWGTNHNFYNTEWQTSDAIACQGAGHTPLFSAPPGSADQRVTGSASLLAFFRGTVGIDPETSLNLNFNPLATPPAPVTSKTRVERSFIVTPNKAVSVVLEDFSKAKGTNTSGVANNIGGAVVSVEHGLIPESIATNLSGTEIGKVPQHDPTQRSGQIEWTAAATDNFFQTNWSAPGIGRSVRDFATLDLRLSRQDTATLNTGTSTDFSIRLVYVGPTGDVVSTSVQLSRYLDLRGPIAACNRRAQCLWHTLLQTARIPLRDFGSVPLDKVRGVQLVFDQTRTGAINVANMQFSRQFEPTPLARPTTAGGAAIYGVEATMAQPSTATIAIEVFSPLGFPVSDAVSVLRIGDQLLTGGRYKDIYTRKMVFSLTPEQFAGLRNGAAVRLYNGFAEIGPGRRFGQLDKRRLKMQEQLLPVQQDARAALQEARDRLAAPQARPALDAILQQLDTTLASNLWRDGVRLDPATGGGVFDGAERALGQLQGLLQSQPRTADIAVVLRAGVSDQLLSVAQGLARDALDQAQAASAASSTLDQVRAALQQGDRAARAEQYVSAIQHYRSAWQQALRAASQP